MAPATDGLASLAGPEEAVASLDEPMRIGLVLASRPADTLVSIGWQGAAVRAGRGGVRVRPVGGGPAPGGDRGAAGQPWCTCSPSSASPPAPSSPPGSPAAAGRSRHRHRPHRPRTAP